MSERDRREYRALKADPERYAIYLEKRRVMRRNKQATRGYETERKRRWRAANPERAKAIHAAHHAVEYAVLTGRMVKPDACSQCGAATELEGHHYNGYAPEHHLDVLWLCQACHSAAHHGPPRPTSYPSQP